MGLGAPPCQNHQELEQLQEGPEGVWWSQGLTTWARWGWSPSGGRPRSCGWEPSCGWRPSRGGRPRRLKTKNRDSRQSYVSLSYILASFSFFYNLINCIQFIVLKHVILVQYIVFSEFSGFVLLVWVSHSNNRICDRHNLWRTHSGVYRHALACKKETLQGNIR